eukprot:gene33356-40349_t
MNAVVEVFGVDDNIPPQNVHNPLNVTAAEVVVQKSWVRKLGKRKAVTLLVNDAEVAQAEVELHKRVKAYNGGDDQAPVWFQNAMAALNERFDALEERFDAWEERSRVEHINTRRMMRNSESVYPLASLLCADIHSEFYGQELPPGIFFPVSHTSAAQTLTNARLDALQGFYGEDCTAGANLAQRVASFILFIGNK